MYCGYSSRPSEKLSVSADSSLLRTPGTSLETVSTFFVNRAWFYPKHLDEAVMQEAASQFVGTHDFAAVRSVGTDVKSTVRTVYYFDVERRGELILLRVCANGFLYNMVRAMTGTVVYAAEGKIRPQDIGRILESGNRTAAGPTVPPGGLYMTHLWYDDGGVAFDA